MIVSVENPKNLGKKISCNNYKLSIIRLRDTRLVYKSQVFFLFTNNEQMEFEMKNISPFTLVLPKMKYLHINLTKYVQYLHEENCKILKKEI